MSQCTCVESTSFTFIYCLRECLAQFDNTWRKRGLKAKILLYCYACMHQWTVLSMIWMMVWYITWINNENSLNQKIVLSVITWGVCFFQSLIKWACLCHRWYCVIDHRIEFWLSTYRMSLSQYLPSKIMSRFWPLCLYSQDLLKHDL